MRLLFAKPDRSGVGVNAGPVKKNIAKTHRAIKIIGEMDKIACMTTEDMYGGAR